MAFTGEKAAIKYKDGETSKNLGRMENWKVSIKNGLVDVTNFDDEGWTNYETGLKSYELSCEGSFSKDDASHKKLMDCMVYGTSLDVELYTLKTDTEPELKGQVKVESIDIDTSVKDKVKVSAKFKGCGKLQGSVFTA